jgi:DNA modification methylase
VTVQLRQGDARLLARDLVDRSIHAVVTSPPYFNARAYSNDARQIGDIQHDLDQYLDDLVDVFGALRPKLAPHAAVWINMGARLAGGGFGAHGKLLRPRPGWVGITGSRHLRRPPAGWNARDVLPVPYLVAEALRRRVPLIWRSEVVWSKPVASEPPRVDRPSRSHESVLLFTNTHPCRARDPGEKWWKESVWRIAVASAKRNNHPASMPLELARRCLVASALDAESLVLDPFAGSGTTLVAAAGLGVSAVGFELEADYLKVAKARLSRNGTERIVTGSDRSCLVCGGPIEGRSDRLTCTDRCRQRQYRRQQLAAEGAPKRLRRRRLTDSGHRASVERRPPLTATAADVSGS